MNRSIMYRFFFIVAIAVLADSLDNAVARTVHGTDSSSHSNEDDDKRFRRDIDSHQGSGDSDQFLNATINGTDINGNNTTGNLTTNITSSQKKRDVGSHGSGESKETGLSNSTTGIVNGSDASGNATAGSAGQKKRHAHSSESSHEVQNTTSIVTNSSVDSNATASNATSSFKYHSRSGSQENGSHENTSSSTNSTTGNNDISGQKKRRAHSSESDENSHELANSTSIITSNGTSSEGNATANGTAESGPKKRDISSESQECKESGFFAGNTTAVNGTESNSTSANSTSQFSSPKKRRAKSSESTEEKTTESPISNSTSLETFPHANSTDIDNGTATFSNASSSFSKQKKRETDSESGGSKGTGSHSTTNVTLASAINGTDIDGNATTANLTVANETSNAVARKKRAVGRVTLAKSASSSSEENEGSDSSDGSNGSDTSEDSAGNETNVTSTVDPNAIQTESVDSLKKKVQIWQNAVSNYLHGARRQRRQVVWSQLFPSPASSTNLQGIKDPTNSYISAAGSAVGDSLKPAVELMTQGVNLLSDLCTAQLSKPNNKQPRITNENTTAAVDKFRNQLQKLQGRLQDLGEQLQRVVGSFQEMQTPFLNNIMSGALFGTNGLPNIVTDNRNSIKNAFYEVKKET